MWLPSVGESENGGWTMKSAGFGMSDEKTVLSHGVLEIMSANSKHLQSSSKPEIAYDN